MANKHVKRCSISQLLIKTTMRYPLTPTAVDRREKHRN